MLSYLHPSPSTPGNPRPTTRCSRPSRTCFGSRETLRNTEQNILFNGAQAYMNVLRDTAILDLQRNNVEVLEEQLRQTRDRFNVGEVTRTDVAQAESRLAAARSQVSLAESNLRTSIARCPPDHRGRAAPARARAAARPPGSDARSRTRSSSGSHEHPADPLPRCMRSTRPKLQVKITEGELYPTARGDGGALSSART